MVLQNRNEIFYLKSAALLHDPPDKACYVVKWRRHEERARELAEMILKGTCLEDALKNIREKADVIERSDRFVSTIDRLLLGILIKDNWNACSYNEIKIKNIFNPCFEEPLPKDIDATNVNRYAKELNEILREIREPNIAYSVLYALYELLWIKHNLPSYPADTRVPTHGVFDHDYATATAINWFLNSIRGEPDGLIITIDIPRVQTYIQASRKLCDLWASSYLISTFVWSIIAEFVKLYGPDIVVLPSCRFNPFFYHHLFTVLDLKGYGGLKDKINSLLKLENGITIYDYNEEPYPRFAVIPATVTFILPSLKSLIDDDEFKGLLSSYRYGGNVTAKDDLINLIRLMLREKWRRFCEVVFSGELVMKRELHNVMDNVIKQLKDFAVKFNLQDIPPFELRVIVKDLHEIPSEQLLYDKLIDDINYELGLTKFVRANPYVNTNISEITTKVYEGKLNLYWEEYSKFKGDGRGFEYCTNCGILPSIIQFASRDDYVNMIKGMGVDEGYIEYVKIYFSEGEKLCPYCLLKRVFTIRPEPFLRKLLGKIKGAQEFKVSYPSVSEFAAFEFKKSLIKHSEMKPEVFESVLKKNRLYEKLHAPEKMAIWAWKYQMRMLNKLKSDIAQKITVYEAEEFLEERRKWLEVGRELDIKPLSMRRYYVIVKADADNMGKLLSGDVEKGVGIDVKKYLEMVYEGPAKDIICCLLKGDFDCAKRRMEVEGVGKNFEEFKNAIESVLRSKRIPVSLAYQVALSKALMLTALQDAKIIEDDYDGIVVYAGGDDLLALLPTTSSFDQVLNIIRDSRKLFSCGSGNCFIRLGEKYFIPTLSTAGRSYSLHIAHYKYPMYIIIQSLIDKLEKEAKEAKWVVSHKQSPVIEKDSISISFLPRGGEAVHAVLPFNITCNSDLKSRISEIAKILDYVSKVLREIDEGVIPTSLIYKVYERENLKRWNILSRKYPHLFELNLKNALKDTLEGGVKSEALNELLRNNLKELSTLFNENIDKCYEQHLYAQFFKSIRAILGGLRGE